MRPPRNRSFYLDEPSHGPTNFFGRRLDLTPIKVQGITVRPGDEILAMSEWGLRKHTYAGRTRRRGKGYSYWTNGPDGRPEPPSSARGIGCGPHDMADLQVPDILTGFIREVGEG